MKIVFKSWQRVTSLHLDFKTQCQAQINTEKVIETYTNMQSSKKIKLSAAAPRKEGRLQQEKFDGWYRYKSPPKPCHMVEEQLAKQWLSSLIQL